MNRKPLENTIAFLFCTTIIVFLCTEIILNLTPPISRDALIHHLAVPKLWLKHGRIYEIPWAELRLLSNEYQSCYMLFAFILKMTLPLNLFILVLDLPQDG